MIPWHGIGDLDISGFTAQNILMILFLDPSAFHQSVCQFLHKERVSSSLGSG